MKHLRLPAIPPRFVAVLLLILAMACFQAGAALAKQMFVVFGAYGMAALRLFFSALIMAILFRPWRGRPTRQDLLLVAGYGIAMGFMNLFFYLALKTLPLGVTVSIEFLGPLSVALLSSRSLLDFVWALLALAGILLLMPVDANATLDLLGIFYALVAALCWALYIVFGQKAGRTLPGQRTAALGIFVGACCVFPFGIGEIDFSLMTPWFLLIAVIVGALSSALPYSLEMFALQKMPTKTFGILMSLEPALAALFGLTVLQEYLSLPQWLAVFFIILASAGSSAFSRTPLKPETSN